MSLLNVLLVSIYLGVALALLSGCIYLLIREKRDRRSMGGEGEGGHRSYMEVWQCPSCNRLSRIAKRCKWCMKEMSGTPRFLTVLEREYTDQLLLPRSEPRRSPPGDPHSPGFHP